jgi:hypothetical protein
MIFKSRVKLVQSRRARAIQLKYCKCRSFIAAGLGRYPNHVSFSTTGMVRIFYGVAGFCTPVKLGQAQKHKDDVRPIRNVLGSQCTAMAIICQ